MPVQKTRSWLLQRYGDVLKAAWARRHDLAGPALLQDEAAFLPAALSLQHTPVHPAPRRVAWAIMSVFASALAWACIGSVDIVAVAPGRTIVAERTKLVQPLERSIVKRVWVRDGDKVQLGQALVELDATNAQSDSLALLEQGKASHSEAWRTSALLSALTGPDNNQPLPMALGINKATPQPSNWSVTDKRQAEVQLQADWHDIRSRVMRLAAEADRRRAELATAREVVAKIEATLPLVRQREDDVKLLSSQGFVAGHTGQDRTRERIELEQDLVTQRARLQEAQAAVSESQSHRFAYLAETRRTLLEREAQATLRLKQISMDQAKAVHRERLTVLVAPVSGVVQQLAAHTTGGVVTEAQLLMVIVPDEPPGSRLVAEVNLENKDAGFVRAGQIAAIKLETFPFTRYGTLPATVQLVSADAVADEKRGAVFPTRLLIQTDHLAVDGRSIRLGPGLNLTAEIKTGQQRVISYLLGPLTRAGSESLRER